MGRSWWPRRWVTVTLSVASALLFVGGAVLMNGLVIGSGPAPRPPAVTPRGVPEAPTTHQPTLWNGGVSPADLMLPTASVPDNGSGGPSSPAGDPPNFCTLPYGVASLGTLALYCYAYGRGQSDILGPAGLDTAKDITIALYNYLNTTAAETANLNATSQELLSYFADRAESLVPYFIGTNWTQVIADEIASYSGLAQATEGVVSALMEQYWQDWNATLWSFGNAFGAGQIYCSGCGGYGATNLLSTAYPNPGGDASGILLEGNQAPGAFNLTPPFELWSSQPLVSPFNANLYGGSPYYMNIEPGGTILAANTQNVSGYHYGTWSITDVTTGNVYSVPQVTYHDFVNVTYPVVSTVDGIAPFDLLKVTCTADCANGNTFLATSGAYVFLNKLAPSADLVGGVGGEWLNSLPNTGNPALFVNSYGVFGGGPLYTSAEIPLGQNGVCINTNDPAIAGTGVCKTGTVPNEGFATQVSNSGPGQVSGGPDVLSQFSQTFQNVLTNAMTLTHSYFDVLNAVTNDSEFAIPATCTIPPPSAAFPASTNPANYLLDVNDTTALYVGYLDSVARTFNSLFAEGTGFCGDANLAFGVNWTTTFQPNLNITASIYLSGPAGAVNLNGTNDSSARFSDPTTWPVKNVQPTFLYPYLFQMNVPVGSVYAVPANDPIAAMLTDFPGNVLYGTNFSSPDWGVPTYLSLAGYGNFVQISGDLSNRNSGHPLATGDAVYVSSCYLGNTAETVCPITVTYYNNFTYGIVHAFIYPSCAQVGDCPGGGGGGLGGLGNLGSTCGFGALNQWYDGWAGFIGSAVSEAFFHLGSAVGGVPVIGGGLAFIIDGIGCLLAWIVVILLFALFVYVAVRVGVAIFRNVRGQRRARRENVS